MSMATKYGKWLPEDMERALQAYRANEFGLNECCRQFGIPKPTFKRHLLSKNKVANEAVKSFGRTPTFTKNFEKVLKDRILEFEERMFGLTISDVRKLAYEVAEKFKIPHSFNKETKMSGKKWFYSFIKRNPELSVRQLESTSMARVKGFNKEKVRQFYDLLKQLVDRHQIDANSIFNVDESGYSTVQKKLPKVVSRKGKRQVSEITSGERGINTTVVCCANAAGLFIPPMIIFKKMRAAPELANGAPLGSLVEVSKSGYINSELFLKWVKHFQKVVQPKEQKPVILLLDGHSTHSLNFDAINFAREHHIHMLQLPGHTTHKLQPLDVAVFKPMQNFYVQAQEAWLRANIGRTISQYNVAGLISEAYGKAATVANAGSAFFASGVWPVNRNRFPDSAFATSELLADDNNATVRPVRVIDETGHRTPPRETGPVDVADNVLPDLEPIPCCSKTLETVDLNEVLPLPKAKKLKVENKPKRSSQAAVILTSTPYRDEIQEKAEKRNKEAIKKVKVNLTAKQTQPKASKKKTSKNKTTKTSDSSSEESELEDEDDAECLFCGDTYLRSRSQEGWIRCQRCSRWAHEECAAKDDLEFICDLCLPNHVGRYKLGAA